jgi:mRNA deadenylase 3'-5' endonuclease subunit Ccr4
MLQADHSTTGEPSFTSYHGQFRGCVDYIWYGSVLDSSSSHSSSSSSSNDDANEQQKQSSSSSTADSSSNCGSYSGSSSSSSSERSGCCLKCESVLEMPLQRELDRWRGLPNCNNASDHLPLLAKFRIIW